MLRQPKSWVLRLGHQHGQGVMLMSPLCDIVIVLRLVAFGDAPQVAGCLGRGQVLATDAGVAAQRLSAVFALLTHTKGT